MSTRARIILISIVILVLGVEIAVRFSGGSKTCVQIVNKGDTLLENLVVSFPGSEIGVGSVPPGESVHVWLSGRRKGTMTLAFKQAGNPTSGFMVDDYDPPFMRRDGLKMVLNVKPNEVEKYMEDDESSTPMGRLGNRFNEWISGELAPLR
jgi:hypothetical protein